MNKEKEGAVGYATVIRLEKKAQRKGG